MTSKSEFRVAGSFVYDQRGAVRWLFSHAWRYRAVALGGILLYVVGHIAYSGARVLIGEAAGLIANPAGAGALLRVGLMILVILVLDGLALLIAAASFEVIANRVARDAREELVASLLGKSQTFHDRQRVGDIMARATDDMQQISGMFMPGLSLMWDAVLAIIVPLSYIALINVQMQLVPLLWLVAYVVALRDYMKKLEPVTFHQRAQYGKMNSRLEETVSGIEIVKASAQEAWERLIFRNNARRYRDYFVEQGEIEARYFPLLLYGIAFGLTFVHAMVLYGQGQLSIADIVAIMGLMAILRFPTFISLFTFTLVQLGLASARRVLAIIEAETELDENAQGYRAEVRGDIRFENVAFGYGDDLLLRDVSFHIEPGQTVAVVGQTGSGKSTLTTLVNRTYDVSAGRILIDGVDVRDWNLDSLRSQVGKIEQDIFLFQRSLAENIAFGAPAATREQIEVAARDAQAHDFISRFPEGYETVIGERGVTLSGGQRQRIALARAFLSDPRILILDDSTSAIDSATEDEIQKALRRAQEERTTLLITHRLSQIRWADLILVLDKGGLAACGTHEELLQSSEHYRRIFARYDVVLPPLQPATQPS